MQVIMLVPLIPHFKPLTQEVLLSPALSEGLKNPVSQ